MKIRTRDSASWWRDEDDGRVTLVVLRKVGAAEGTWLELEFTAKNERGCLSLYELACQERYERAKRLSERREKWGPSELRALQVVS